MIGSGLKVGKIKTLRASSCFRGFEPRELALVASLLEERELLPGERFLDEGSSTEGLSLVAAGSIDLRTRLPSGGESARMAIGPGRSFGELALLGRGGGGDGGGFVSAAAGGEGARLLTLRPEAFDRLTRVDSKAAAKLLRNLLAEFGRVARDAAEPLKKLLG